MGIRPSVRWFTGCPWGPQESASRACRKRPFHCDPCLPKPLLTTPYIDSALTKEKESLPARDLATHNSSLTEETPCSDGNLCNTGTERNKPTKLLLPKCPRQTTSAGPSLLCHHSPSASSTNPTTMPNYMGSQVAASNAAVKCRLHTEGIVGNVDKYPERKTVLYASGRD